MTNIIIWGSEKLWGFTPLLTGFKRPPLKYLTSELLGIRQFLIGLPSEPEVKLHMPRLILYTSDFTCIPCVSFVSVLREWLGVHCPSVIILPQLSMADS